MEDGLQKTVRRQDIFNFLKRGAKMYTELRVPPPWGQCYQLVNSKAAASVGPSSQPVLVWCHTNAD